MAFLELAVVVLAFGTMAVVFGLQERAEWRRLVASADAVLARQRSSGARTFDEPGPDGLREAA
jgi:hypothetical protein